MQRADFIEIINNSYETFPIVAILGPRQCGKTTLARMYADQAEDYDKAHYFDLENNLDIERLHNPLLALAELVGLIVIDEIQKIPELFKTLRVLVDRPSNQQRYLILGSASRELIRQSSESLAGRIKYIELTPFSSSEVEDIQKLWIRGGFPRSYLAKSNDASFEWRQAYIKTFLEQDIPNLGIKIPPIALRRFWMMLCHYHGKIFSASEIGKSLGLSDKTIKHYLDILTGTFMVRTLLPWFENINKRQIKSPKIYFRDSGLYHTLLNITDYKNLLVHPNLGASWEGVALEEIIRFEKVDGEQCYFWGIHAQAELDLLMFKENKCLGFEFKYTDKPRVTTSLQSALEHLKLDHIYVISPGEHHFKLASNITAVGLKKYLALGEMK